MKSGSTLLLLGLGLAGGFFLLQQSAKAAEAPKPGPAPAPGPIPGVPPVPPVPPMPQGACDLTAVPEPYRTQVAAALAASRVQLELAARAQGLSIDDAAYKLVDSLEPYPDVQKCVMARAEALGINWRGSNGLG